MNSLHLKRPKRVNDEDEDDLIAFQENFLKNKTNEQPAAKCVKKQQPLVAELIQQNATKQEINCKINLRKDVIIKYFDLRKLSSIKS